MGRKRNRKKQNKTRKQYPGGWRQVLAENPLSAGGYALRQTEDKFDDQVAKELERAKPKDWWAPRGVRHP